MSYRCDECDRVQEGQELKRISEVREVNYRQFVPKFDKKERKKKAAYHKSHLGLETVKEQRLCSECYDKFSDEEPRISDKPKDVNFFTKHYKHSENTSYKTGQGRTVKSFQEL